MNLHDTLRAIAADWHFDADALIAYAAEDTWGGYDGGHGTMPNGSLWTVEGKTLYALVRATRPQAVVEIGTLRGASANHIAEALRANGEGHLLTIDISGGGDLIADDLRPYITQLTADGLGWLMGQADASIDLLYEDSSHGTDMCAAVGMLAKRKLAPDGWFVTHDAAHDFAILSSGRISSPVGAEIRAGLSRAGIDYRVYLSEPSDCGLAIWRQSEHAVIPLIQSSALEDTPDAEILADIRQGFADIAAGDYRDADEVLGEMKARRTTPPKPTTSATAKPKARRKG